MSVLSSCGSVTLGFPAARGTSRKPEELYVRRQTARMRLSKYAAYNTYHHCEQCHHYMGFHPRYQVGRGAQRPCVSRSACGGPSTRSSVFSFRLLGGGGGRAWKVPEALASRSLVSSVPFSKLQNYCRCYRNHDSPGITRLLVATLTDCGCLRFLDVLSWQLPKLVQCSRHRALLHQSQR